MRHTLIFLIKTISEVLEIKIILYKNFARAVETQNIIYLLLCWNFLIKMFYITTENWLGIINYALQKFFALSSEKQNIRLLKADRVNKCKINQICNFINAKNANNFIEIDEQK